jgi:hypothetical protein
MKRRTGLHNRRTAQRSDDITVGPDEVIVTHSEVFVGADFVTVNPAETVTVVVEEVVIDGNSKREPLAHRRKRGRS